MNHKQINRTTHNKKCFGMTLSIIILLLGLSIPSCDNHPEYHDVKGLWSVGGIVYDDLDCSDELKGNMILFNEGDSITLPSYGSQYPGSTGKYYVEYNDIYPSTIVIQAGDSLFDGTYNINWKYYYPHPNGRDSILVGMTIESRRTSIWLNNRITGWW